jgi:hypothetical protein
VVGCSYNDRKRLVGAGNGWISNPMCWVRIRDTKKGKGLSENLKNFSPKFFSNCSHEYVSWSIHISAPVDIAFD